MVATIVILIFAAALSGGIAIAWRWNGLAGIAWAIAIGLVCWVMASLGMLVWFVNAP